MAVCAIAKSKNQSQTNWLRRLFEQSAEEFFEEFGAFSHFGIELVE